MRSQAVDILAGWLDILLLDIDSSKEYKQDSSGWIHRIWNGHSPMFRISKISKEYEKEEDRILYLKEKEMLEAISKIQIGHTGRKLHNEFVQMFNNLINTKSYSTVYAVPVIYNYLVDNLIKYEASVETVIIVREYFDVLCNEIQGILESCFGDLLYSYDKTSKFNFAEYFQINQYGNDGSNLNGILNVISKYKGLIAGCYVFIKAIASSQSSLQNTNYSVALDENLFKLLADGDKPGQNTATEILDNWKKEKIGIKPDGNEPDNRVTIIEGLDKLYSTYLEWGKMTNDYISNILKDLDIDSNLDVELKVDKINQALSSPQLINGLNNLFTDFSHHLSAINDILKPGKKKKITQIFITTAKGTLIETSKSNIKIKRESINNYKSLYKKSDSCKWTQKGGCFFHQI